MILLVLAVLIGVVIWIFDGMPAKIKTALTVAAVVLIVAFVFDFLGYPIQGLLKR